MKTTSLQPVAATPTFSSLEEKVLDFWRQSRAFEKLQKNIAGRPLFRFIDGPITANNPMGVHHAWGRTLKDVFIRYQVMRGHSCRFQNGFDCQGLWVEVEVERELGFNGKPDIEKFGLANFSRKCRERVEKYAQVITDQSIRLGQWMDWDHSYYTHDDGNILGIWWFLKKCFENGWLYRKGLPMPWCPRCGTSLSEHEMAGSHQEVEHLSIFAHLPLKDDPTRRILFWTTTPWTLSANVAGAVNPELTYCEVSSPRWPYRLILCKDALHVLKPYQPKVERAFPGAELVGKHYETFFPEFEPQKGVDHRIIAWKDVGATEGSGVVHIAPGCGREDFELGQQEGLAEISPVDESGHFIEGFGPLTGQHAAEVPEQVAQALDKAGKLLRAENYRHAYPVCWRCKGELIFRLVEEWFISCDQIRPRMIEAARTVRWTPEYVGKAMEDWLGNMGDWCISRKRYWGLPLPFYICKPCGTVTVAGSREELRSLAIDPAKLDAVPELHRPWIDEVRIRCPKCGGEVPRVVEVGDCWLDAGIVPYSTLGYFDNRAHWEKAFPAEWISEMREQVRLWFYSMLFMAVTLDDRSPYEQVLSYETVVSEDGARFSKTGFMIHFDDAVARIGADPMRYLFCSRPVSTDCRFGFSLGDLAARKILDLWNIYAFFTNYALVDLPDLSKPAPPESYHVTDRWLLARTARLIEHVTQAYDEFDTPEVIRTVEAHLDHVSNWYVRVNRRRFWRNGHAEDKHACYSALLAALRSTVLALAPIVPFVTEEIWQNLVRSFDANAPESVHHEAWPEAPAAWRNDALLDRTETVRAAIGLGLKLRSQASVRIRQPLRAAFVVAKAPAQEAIREQAATLQAELNVKEVKVLEDAAMFHTARLQIDLKAAGAHLRGDLGKVKTAFNALPSDAMPALVKQFDGGADIRLPGYEAALPASIFRNEQAVRPGFSLASDGNLTVALDLTITDDLKREGLARDLVRNLQVLRKESGLALTDRIELGLATDSEELRSAIAEYRDYIQDELLAVDLVPNALPSPTARAELKIGAQPVVATLRSVPASGDGRR